MGTNCTHSNLAPIVSRRGRGVLRLKKLDFGN